MVSLWEGFIATLHLRTINQINCTLSSVQWHHQFDHIFRIGCKNIRYLRHEIMLLFSVHPTSCFRSLKQLFTWTFSWKWQILFSCCIQALPIGSNRKKKKKVRTGIWNWLVFSPSNPEFYFQLNWRLMSHKIYILQLTIKCINIISKVKQVAVQQLFSDTLLAGVKKTPRRSHTMLLKNR